jgi:hypothetical protein
MSDEKSDQPKPDLPPPPPRQADESLKGYIERGNTGPRREEQDPPSRSH